MSAGRRTCECTPQQVCGRVCACVRACVCTRVIERPPTRRHLCARKKTSDRPVLNSFCKKASLPSIHSFAKERAGGQWASARAEGACWCYCMCALLD